MKQKHIEFLKEMSKHCLAHFSNYIDVVVGLSVMETAPTRKFINEHCGTFLALAAYFIALRIVLPTEYEELTAKKIKEYEDEAVSRVIKGIAYRIKIQEKSFELPKQKIQDAIAVSGYQ